MRRITKQNRDSKVPALAKLSLPRLGPVVERERLHLELDGAFAEGRIVWLNAAAGAGKTTLALSYLQSRNLACLWYQVDARDADPASFFYYLRQAADEQVTSRRNALPLLTAEYLQGLAVFSRNFFDELFSMFDSRLVLVLDNYQEVPDAAPLHGLLSAGLDGLPAHVSILVLSRAAPPSAYARLLSTFKLHQAPVNMLALSRDETAAIACLHSVDRLAEDELTALHGRTEGWVTGTLLLLEQHKHGEDIRTRLGSDTGGVIFEYLQAEIFDRVAPEQRSMLLITSILPEVSETAAMALTGNNGSMEVLQDLARRNLFVVRLAGTVPIYRYHPLFQEFLLARLTREFDAEFMAELYRCAAEFYAHAENFEDALYFWRKAGAWNEAAGLLQARAPELLAQGRGQLLESVTVSLPDDILRQYPWLQYQLGLHRLTFGPTAARAILESAYQRFCETGDVSGELHAWAAIVDTYIYAWADMHPLDGWIDIMSQRLRSLGDFPNRQAEERVICGMFIALMYRQPQHPDLPAWTEQVRDIVFYTENASLRLYIGTQLLLYDTWWSGELARAGLIVDLLKPLTLLPGISPLVTTTWHMMSAAYFWMTAENDKAVATAETGLRIGEQTGVHSSDMLTCGQALFATISSGKLATAKTYLDHVTARIEPGRLLDNAIFHHLSAWYHLSCGDIDAASEHAKLSVALVERAGSPFFDAHTRNVHGLILSLLGNPEAGLAMVSQARKTGRALQSGTVEYLTWLVESEIRLEHGDESDCLAALRNCLESARRYGFRNHTWWRSAPMSRLYARALAHGIEVDYVQSQIKLRQLQPEGVPEHELDGWPWPFRIYTLGRFGIQYQGEPIEPNGRGQRKPIEMLTTLIALGGRNVAEELLCERLWPDAEGDAAHLAFKTTLHRLRKLLGDDCAIVIHGGRVSLNPQRVWIDCWAFERTLRDIESLASEHDTGRLIAHIQQAARLYHGPFLAREPENAATLGYRERLRARWLKILRNLISVSARHKDCDRVLELHRLALEVDDLAEEFYQGLMRCYLARGRRADALRIYQRAQAAMAAVGVEPSPATRQLFEGTRDSGRQSASGCEICAALPVARHQA